jgi:hypothetical protein
VHGDQVADGGVTSADKLLDIVLGDRLRARSHAVVFTRHTRLLVTPAVHPPAIASLTYCDSISGVKGFCRNMLGEAPMPRRTMSSSV